MTVGAHDAKTRFSELLDRAARGEVITVSRHGVPVVRLVPVDQVDHDEERRAVAKIRETRRGVRLDGLAIRSLMNEGRP